MNSAKSKKKLNLRQFSLDMRQTHNSYSKKTAAKALNDSGTPPN